MKVIDKNSITCCVAGCENTYNTKISVKFYSFPKHRRDRHRRELWIKTLRDQDFNKTSRLWEPTDSSRICSEHFIGGQKSKYPESLSYIPTIFPKVPAVTTESHLNPGQSVSNTSEPAYMENSNQIVINPLVDVPSSKSESPNPGQSISDMGEPTSTENSDQTIFSPTAVKMEYMEDDESTCSATSSSIPYNSFANQVQEEIMIKEEQIDIDQYIQDDEEYDITEDDIRDSFEPGLDSSPICSVVTFDDQANEIDYLFDNSNPKLNDVNAILENPTLLYKCTGLENVQTFYEILSYIENELETIEETCKNQQLFCVLTKLHTNINAHCINKFIFPAVYVNVIEIFYKKVHSLLKGFSNSAGKFPECLMQITNNKKNRGVIISVLKINCFSNRFQLRNERKSVKYVIAYTLTGKIFYVSKYFAANFNAFPQLQKLGVLDDIIESPNSFFLYKQNFHFYKVNVAKYLSDSCAKSGNVVQNDGVEGHIKHLVCRIQKTFKVLEETFPSYMILKMEGDTCFLDKLVSICCFLLNVSTND